MTRLNALRQLQSSVNLASKIAVIVGGTAGIGEGIALRLAQAKCSVYILGRSEQRGSEVVAKCKALGAGAASTFIPCDATLLSNVKKACNSLEALVKDNPRIDLLVLTQGMATLAGRTETTEGLDKKLALHYYSRMAFVQCLAPLMKNSSDPRVLSVLSAGVHSPYRQYKEDPELKANFSLKNAADCAGFYNDLAADFFSELHAPIKFFHACPGLVATSWGTEMPFLVRCAIRLLQKAGTSPSDCAEYMCSALFSAELQGKRFYLMAQDGSPAKPTAMHDEAKAFVRDHTLQVLDKLLV